MRQGHALVLTFLVTETRDIRRRWCVAVRYQIALLNPDVNFFPFDYAPPTGDDPSLAVLMSGELERLSYDGGRNWSKSLIVLRSTEFSLFTGTEVGCLTVYHCEVSLPSRSAGRQLHSRRS
jgi:hypothetical protein